VGESNLSGGEGNVEEWHVTEEGDEDSLEAKTKVTEAVHHALLSEGEISGLADHQISPLDANDGDQVTGLSHLEGLSGVANGEVGDDRLSVEPRSVSIRVPSANGVSINSSERLVALLSLDIGFADTFGEVGVVKSNI
jgi:hypothetical protein